MRKVLVIGSPGAGKSTLGKALARLTGLPLYHLDALYWKPNWAKTPNAEWDELLRRLVAEPAWIIDGNYGRTLDIRIQAADTVIWLDKPRLLCEWRVIKRRVTAIGRVRSDMGDDCVERLLVDREFVAFLRFIWNFPKASGIEGKLRRLAGEGSGKRIIRLRSDREAAAYLAQLRQEGGH